MSIDICIPYGPREDLIAPYAKTINAWMVEGIRPLIGEAWSEGVFHHSRARNLAVAKGSAPWLLIVDADMIPEPGALRKLLDILTDDRSGACYNFWNWRVPDPEWPNRVETSSSIDSRVADWLADGDQSWDFIWKHSREWRGNRVYGPSMVRRDIYEKIGGQHEGFIGWGCEDDDFFATLKRRGTPLVPADSPRFIQAPHVSTRLVDSTQGTSYQRNYALLMERLSRP